MTRYASSPLPVLERLRPLLVPDDIEGDDKLVDMFWRMETIDRCRLTGYSLLLGTAFNQNQEKP